MQPQTNTKQILFSILAVIIILGIIAGGLFALRGVSKQSYQATQESETITKNADKDVKPDDNDTTGSTKTPTQNETQTPPSPSENKPATTLPVTGIQPQSLDSTVELLYANAFKKTVVNDQLDCGGDGPTNKLIVKRTEYQGKQSTMSVIDSADVKLYDSSDVNSFNNVLINGSKDSATHTEATNNLMHRACGGFGVQVLSELDLKGYGIINVGASRAYLAIVGNGVNFSPSVVVYANKGGSLIQIIYYLRTGSEADIYNQNAAIACQNTDGEYYRQCVSDTASSIENTQLAYVALTKISQDYQIKGPQTLQDVTPITTGTDELQTLNLTLTAYYQQPGVEGAVFKDSTGKLYVMKNNSDLNASVRKIVGSDASSERIYNAQFVITAQVNMSIEEVMLGSGSLKISYELTRLQRYTYSY